MYNRQTINNHAFTHLVKKIEFVYVGILLRASQAWGHRKTYLKNLIPPRNQPWIFKIEIINMTRKQEDNEMNIISLVAMPHLG